MKVEIRTENAAFEDNPIGVEVANILRRLADTMEEEHTDFLPEDSFYLFDSNGNRCGRVTF